MFCQKILLFLIICLKFFSSVESIEIIDQNVGPMDRIIGGINANISKYPFMVSLQFLSEKTGKWSHICGATIIEKKWIMTAAHCILGNDTLRNYSAVIGTTNLDDPNPIRINLDLIVVNGCFGLNDISLKDDIALLKTEREMIEPGVRSVYLPQQSAHPSTRKLFITGWGISQINGIQAANVLQMAETELFSEQLCLYMMDFANMGLFTFEPTGTKLCVHSLNNSGCQGDSGGPLFEVTNGKPVQVGITSHGTSNVIALRFGFHCYRSEPIMYTKVSEYISWIKNNIEEYNDSEGKKILYTICGSKL